MRLRTVVVISDNANVSGGNAQVALSSVRSLASAGIKCIFFAANGTPPPELLGLPNLEFVILGQPEAQDDPSRMRGAVRGLWNGVAAQRLVTLLSALDPSSTVVHVHSFIKALSSSVINVAAARNFRVVMTLHDYFLVCPNGSLYNHQTQSICPLRPMGAACVTTNCDPRSAAEKGYRVLRQLIGRHVGKVPSGITDFITVSEFSRDVFARYVGNADRLHFVENPSRLTRGRRAPIAENTEYSYIGRLSPEKGVRILVEAARETKLPTTFIGDGALRSDLESSAPGNVTFTGWLSQAEVSGRLMRSRALVLPSLWYEAAPLVIAQAASLGVPIVVSKGTAAESMIAEGVSGFAFERGNVSDLAQKMRLLDDGALADRVGRSAYDRYWQARPPDDTHRQDLLAVYERMLSQPRANRETLRPDSAISPGAHRPAEDDREVRIA